MGLGFGLGPRDRGVEAAGEVDGLGAGGEEHTAPATDEERIIEQLAEATEGVAHRRLGDARALGRLGDASFAGEGIEGD